MLEVCNLSTWIQTSKDQYVKAVDDISFSIQSGETFALIGESGSGKSMTALSVLRILPSSAAYLPMSKILFHGQDLLALPENRMRRIRGADIAMIFQNPMSSFNPIYTIGQQILEVLRLHQLQTGRSAYVEALRLLEAVKIKDPVNRFNSYPHELSGGMLQRSMIAMALACKPSLLIADEPTTALDVTTQASILSLLKELQQQENLSLLLITHDLAIASQLADKVAVMQQGKIVEQNSSAQFFKAAKNPYSQKLLANLPSMLHSNVTQTQPSAPLLSVQNLRVYFPVRNGFLRRKVAQIKAVDDVSLTLYTGQTTAIVGESGSGKTTVAKAVLGLLKQATGSIEYQNNNLLQLNSQEWQAFRADIQIIFQDPYSALNAKMRIYDSLEEGMLLQGRLSAQQRDAKIDYLLSQVGLDPKRKWQYPHQFSGGERQRICIARALSVDPKIIVCDEPTSSLDVSVQAQVLQLMLRLQKELGLTYLFISHDLSVVRLLAQNVLVLKDGVVVEAGTAEQIFDFPREAYTKQLLAAAPRLRRFN